MPKTDDSFSLDYCDIFLINDIWETFYDNKEYDSFVGAKNWFGLNPEELRKHYKGKLKDYWTAKINTIKNKLNRLSKMKLIMKKEGVGKKSKNIYFPNPKRASLRKSRFPDNKKMRRFLVCLDSRDKLLILEY